MQTADDGASRAVASHAASAVIGAGDYNCQLLTGVTVAIGPGVGVAGILVLIIVVVVGLAIGLSCCACKGKKVKVPKKLQEKLPTKMPGTKKKTQTGDGADDPVKV